MPITGEASLDEFCLSVSEELRALPVVNAASIRAVRRDLSARVDSIPARDAIELAIGIVDEGAPGAYPVVYEMLVYHPTALSAIRAIDLRKLGKHMNAWGDVDCFSAVAGRAWRIDRISDSEVHRWARSRSRWWRRAALVCTVSLNMRSHGGKGDSARTLEVCALLLDDRDDMVVKAMSWALRALSTRDPRSVEAFLNENDGRLAPRVVREVGNKLRTGRKDGRRNKANDD